MVPYKKLSAFHALPGRKTLGLGMSVIYQIPIIHPQRKILGKLLCSAGEEIAEEPAEECHNGTDGV